MKIVFIQHDITLDKLDAEFVNNKFTKVLPFPNGQYAIQTYWSAYNKLRASVTAHMHVTY